MSQEKTPRDLRREKFAGLVAEGMAIGAAASEVGISPNTASRWMNDPDVVAYLADQSERLRAVTADRLVRFASQALTRAEYLLEDPKTPPGVVARLVAFAFAESRAWVEIDELIRRIEAVERVRGVAV